MPLRRQTGAELLLDLEGLHALSQTVPLQFKTSLDKKRRSSSPVNTAGRSANPKLADQIINARRIRTSTTGLKLRRPLLRGLTGLLRKSTCWPWIGFS